MIKIFIIIILLIFVGVLCTPEEFDISANLNLLTDKQSLNDKAIVLPIDYSNINDNEYPKQVDFNKKIKITDLQKLKAVNNILERIKDIHTFNVFNPALRPVTVINPDQTNINYINNYIVNKIAYYSGNQYTVSIVGTNNMKGHETDDQYLIQYNLTSSINNIDDTTVNVNVKKLIFNIIISVIITKEQLNKTLDIYFNELRIDNPDIYITPNKPNISYEEIN